MKRRHFLCGGLVIALMRSLGAAADRPPGKPVAPEAKVANTQIVAYYFHGTVRCETCQKIELQARAAIERRFAKEIAGNRLSFVPVNYDLPENRAYVEKYQLPCPSLVLVRQKGGKDEKWKLLKDTWDLIEQPDKFNRYVEEETAKYLGGS
jgi:hypothetical protein